MKDRDAIDRELDAIAAWVPVMLAETNEADQMDAFAGRAEALVESAGADDAGYIHDRLQRILVDNCMVPADEGPCA